MIKLNNVTKTYISTATQRVDALKDVSFELGNKELVCILGKSGSGKSTLLNLLGGLDRVTSGEIVVDGVSMNNFTADQYSGYRNGYVGFIFQEYNLISDFNVKDNIALALQLSHGDNIDAKVMDALQQVELSEKYLTRRVGEMSGGEKQRIAIARCIVKNSKMILADEPTGNLDSATGESIWNILKRLSQNKLVVVVTHDRESAEKYADRVIEIADGSVISDNGATDTSTAVSEPFTTQKKRLPLRASLNMGFKSMLHRKVKTISVILLSIFSILALTITQMCLCFSSMTTILRYMSDNDIPYITISQQSYLPIEEGYTYVQSVIRPKTIDYLSDNTTYIIDGMVESKQQLLDFGFTFVGDALEISENSYYVTSECFEQYVNDGRAYVEIDGHLTRVIKELHPTEYLIGKPVYLGYAYGDETDVPILAGIIDSNCINEYVKEMTPQLFASKDVISRAIEKVNLNTVKSDLLLQLGDSTVFNDSFTISTTIGKPWDEHRVLTIDGQLVNEESITLRDNEMLLSFDLFSRLFEAGSRDDYVDFANGQVIELPEQLGQTFEFNVYDGTTNDVIANFGEFKLVGIRFETAPSIIQNKLVIMNMAVSKQAFVDVGFELNPQATVLISVGEIDDIRQFLSTVSGSEYLCSIDQVGSVFFTDSTPTTDCASLTFEFDNFISTFVVIVGVICLIMLIVLILLVINLISFSITARKREIGILSALGTSNRDITRIFIFETLVIAAISFVFTLILTVCFGVFANNWYCSNYVQPLHFFRVDAFVVLTIAIATFGLLLLAAWIPIRKIRKLKPIDAIRNVR